MSGPETTPSPIEPAAAPPRRTRVPRGTLSRQAVIDAAARVLRRETTLDGLTLQRVADELGVKPMSLYTHVRSKQDLIEGVAGELFSGLTAEPSASSISDVRELNRRYFRLLIEYPALVQIVTTHQALYSASDAISPIVDLGARVARESPLDERSAMNVLRTMSRFTLGSAAMYHERRDLDGDGTDEEELFEFGLELLLGRLQRAPADDDRPAGGATR